jgi:hypothetical protein
LIFGNHCYDLACRFVLFKFGGVTTASSNTLAVLSGVCAISWLPTIRAATIKILFHCNEKICVTASETKRDGNIIALRLHFAPFTRKLNDVYFNMAGLLASTSHSSVPQYADSGLKFENFSKALQA